MFYSGNGNSFEGQAPVNLIYGGSIREQVAVTWLRDRAAV